MMNFNEFDEEILKTYNREQVFFIKGKGAYLKDSDGNKWLDFLSGIGVINFGHCHSKLVNALKKQIKEIWHTSNIYYIEPQGQTAKKISEISFPGKTFFCNSGAEANEAAIKLCRKWGSSISKEKNVILSLKQSFHGRTLGSLTLTGQEIYHGGFEPLVPEFQYIEPNDVNDLKAKINDKTAGLFLEIVQGEGGVNPLSKEFVEAARELTKKSKALLIIDEIQTGMGRTGKPFSYQHFDIEPDGFTLAKALGNGIPIGAFHVKNEFAVLKPGDHASTFGGNFLSTAVASCVLDILKEPGFFNKMKESSLYLEKRLKETAKDSKIIKEIRGIGLMWGIVSDSAAQIYRELFNEKVLVSNIKNKVVRLLPPLIIGKQEVDLFIEKLKKALLKIEKSL